MDLLSFVLIYLKMGQDLFVQYTSFVFGPFAAMVFWALVIALPIRLLVWLAMAIWKRRGSGEN